MNLIIGAVVIIIIIASVVFFMSGKAKNDTTQTKMHQETDIKEAPANIQKSIDDEKSRDVKVYKKTEELVSETKSQREEFKPEKGTEAVERKEQKEQLYYYMNRELQNLFYIYNKDEWESLNKLGEIPSILYSEVDKVIEELPSLTGRMVKEYFSCIDFKEEEGKFIGYVKDVPKLKDAFLQFMMPFYPYYYKQLSEGGLRHTALLHPNTLRLFQQLTGKKFRPGYRNRYSTGVRAFEWDKNRYKVYQKDGRLLCDAVFGADGIIDGYGQKKYLDKKNTDWNIVEEGNWENGVFQGGILRYEYKKAVK